MCIGLFLGSVSIEGNMVISGLLDGVDISVLDQQAMYLDRDQDITGNKVGLNVIVSIFRVSIVLSVNILLPTYEPDRSFYLHQNYWS